MTRLVAVRCASCGGAVASRPEQALPSCLFCGADARELMAFDKPETVEDPVGAIGFERTDSEAHGAFVAFATSSFWYPNDLRHADLTLRRLLVPAWAWSGRLETHFTGLVRARTRSGKRPVADAEERVFDQVLVPASQTLTPSELRGLGRYDEAALAPFDPDLFEAPYELSEVTRSVARDAAQEEMARRHRSDIAAERALSAVHAASVAHDLSGRPVLVPVFIGAYRYNDVTWRILVNGQTGVLVGDAPTSWRKVLAVALLALLAVGVVAGIVLSSG